MSPSAISGVCCPGDLPHAADHVGVAGKPCIRQAEMRGDDAEAGHVQRVETHASAMRAEIMSNTPGAEIRPGCFKRLANALSSLMCCSFLRSVWAIADAVRASAVPAT